MTQAIQEVQGESGPNGERVFKPINDQHDAVRLSSGSSEWLQSIDSNGQHPFINVSGTIEISFYGTGLNLITGYYTGSLSFDIRATIDGGSEGANFMPASTTSGILGGRNYNSNQIINVASNLSLGLHTIKLRIVSLSTTFILFGYEVLNTNSTLQLLPGRSYLGGKRLYKAAASTDAYNSNFESGTLGTKGGHVVVYQKSDGTVAKAVTPTNASQANLGSTNHTNESLIRSYQWREFGSGRTDDFSLLTNASPVDRAFTLDDGTTTLVGKNCIVDNPTVADTYSVNTDGAGFTTFTFVGTGLDITWATGGAGTNGATAWEVFIDGASVGYWDTVATSNVLKIKSICSGLPYGTHTVKIARNTVSTWALAFKSFDVYGPSKPSLPSGAIELADYYLMADYVNDAASPNTVDTISTGVLRKLQLREMVYSGTWNVDSFTAGVAGGFSTYTSVATADFVEYTFVGTGFNFRSQGGTGGGSLSWTASLNGPGNTNWTSYTSSISTGGTVSTWTASTGVISIPTSASRYTLFVSGLPFGKHTVRLTKTSGAVSSYFNGFDIIIPVHSPKNNQPGDLQNTLPLGSCAIGDSRKFSSTAVKTLANWAQARGITSSPTTTSTFFVPVPDMSVSIKTSGNPVQVAYNVASTINAAGQTVDFIVYIDGVSLASSRTQLMPSLSGYRQTATCAVIVPLAAGFHKIDVYWLVSGNTATAVDVTRQISVMEI
jgi:hypothetical protein